MKICDGYAVRYRDAGRPLDAGDLDRCQRELGLDFPSAYREFLLDQNGGRPTPRCFLINHAVSPQIERFHSVDSTDPSTDVRHECERLRADFKMPPAYIPIARTVGDGGLLVSCAGNEIGRLYYWPRMEDGFRMNDPEFDTVTRLYFGIEELPDKLGPARNREDRDALFFRLYWAASIPQSGAKTAEQLVRAGYDINFVIAGFRHPVFAAIDCDAFSVAEKLIALGTRRDHADPRHADATVVDRLSESLAWWKNRLGEHNRGETIYEMAARRVSAIESALAVYSSPAPE